MRVSTLRPEEGRAYTIMSQLQRTSLFNEGSMSPYAQGSPPPINTSSQKNTTNVVVGNLPALSCLKCNKRTILGTERGCQVLKTVTYPCKTHVVPVNLAESFSSLDEDDMKWTILYSSTEQSAESALLIILTVFKYVDIFLIFLDQRRRYFKPCNIVIILAAKRCNFLFGAK